MPLLLVSNVTKLTLSATRAKRMSCTVSRPVNTFFIRRVKRQALTGSSRRQEKRMLNSAPSPRLTAVGAEQRMRSARMEGIDNSVSTGGRSITAHSRYSPNQPM